MENETRMQMAHELWLVYGELKDVEAQPEFFEALSSACRKLGQLINALNRPRFHSAEDLQA